MAEDISTQLLVQASENINKLYDLVTRIDERLNTVRSDHKNLDTKLSEISRSYNEVVQRIASLETTLEVEKPNLKKILECEKELNGLDKRLETLEVSSNKSQNRWNKAIWFVIQLAWVVLAAWLLTKLNLQAPAVP